MNEEDIKVVETSVFAGGMKNSEEKLLDIEQPDPVVLLEKLAAKSGSALSAKQDLPRLRLRLR